MQTKAELQLRMAQTLGAWRKPLGAAERAVDDWAMVDEHQAVLEVLGADGGLLRHYMNRYSLRACGLCFDHQQVGEMRRLIPGAEIMPATAGDIPWQGDSFDRVLMAHPLPRYVDLTAFLKEVLRVLRPGGRLCIAWPCWPALQYGAGQDKRLMMRALEALGFGDVSLRRSRLGYASIVAAKADE